MLSEIHLESVLSGSLISLIFSARPAERQRLFAPDNWIPRAQGTAGDDRLSIYPPPPHELIESILPDGPFVIAPTPEEGSPAVVPPPNAFSFSRSSHPLWLHRAHRLGFEAHTVLIGYRYVGVMMQMAVLGRHLQMEMYG
jgi:hypothetical protein